jgi:hypothetical protein
MRYIVFLETTFEFQLWIKLKGYKVKGRWIVGRLFFCTVKRRDAFEMAGRRGCVGHSRLFRGLGVAELKR